VESTQDSILKGEVQGISSKVEIAEGGMDVVYPRCAGLDVHKKTVVACRIVPDAKQEWRREVRKFNTMTADLLVLADWLRAAQVTHVAMESTGVYWKPIYNILEGDFEVMLVNAQHIKFVPGRKTDINDAQWIAQLLHHGLLRASYIPPRPQRELRDLVRYRTQLVQDRAREINRVQKVLEDANLKLGSVVSDVMGISSRDMLQHIIAGVDDPVQLAQLARGRLRDKIAELEQALTGQVRAVHRLLLKLHLEQINDITLRIETLSAEIERLMRPFDTTNAIVRLDAIPGVSVQTAQIILAELGTDMSRFPTARHAAAWAGLAPGKNESAGRNRSSKVRDGNQYLKVALIQAAHALSHMKDTYLSAQYRRLAARRGRKRAAVAVAHSILVIAYHMLKRGTEYVDLGGDYFDRRNQEYLQRNLVNRLERLGLKVSVEPLLSAS
jgi:transposase